MINLRKITEENFIDAFNLKLAPEQERFVSHPNYIKAKPFGSSNRVTLTCNRDNIQALNLYKSRGFTETGTVDEDEIELSLTIH